MDIVVKGHRVDVPERFRSHVSEKLSKLSKFDQKVIRVDVEVSEERNPRLADRSDRVELTVHSKGPVIRAEAAASDRHAALDLAIDKLIGRMRKAADRRRVHRGNRTPISVAAATAGLNGAGEPPAGTPGEGSQDDAAAAAAAVATMEPQADGLPDADGAEIRVEQHGPMIVREKTHQATPMTRDQALYEMELIGHDFYLYVDADSKQPSVVYRRRGYDYGVIRLDV